MFRSIFITGALAILCTVSYGQSLVRSGSTMLVHPGTTITIPEGQSLEIETSSSLENNGSIRLLGSANLIEAQGFPVFGSGTETSHSFQGNAMTMTEPGGLGLGFTQSTAVDSLHVTRGHVPLTDNQNVQGVARWYSVESDNWNGSGSLFFYIDNTELNGIANSALVLHQSETGAVWAYVPGVINAMNVLAASPIDSLGVFTLFGDTSVALIPEEIDHALLAVYPNPANEDLIITGPDPAVEVNVFDMSGQEVGIKRTRVDAHSFLLSISHLARGIYTIRTNTGQAIRFVKQ